MSKMSVCVCMSVYIQFVGFKTDSTKYSREICRNSAVNWPVVCS